MAEVYSGEGWQRSILRRSRQCMEEPWTDRLGCLPVHPMHSAKKKKNPLDARKNWTLVAWYGYNPRIHEHPNIVGMRYWWWWRPKSMSTWISIMEQCIFVFHNYAHWIYEYYLLSIVVTMASQEIRSIFSCIMQRCHISAMQNKELTFMIQCCIGYIFKLH